MIRGLPPFTNCSSSSCSSSESTASSLPAHTKVPTSPKQAFDVTPLTGPPPRRSCGGSYGIQVGHRLAESAAETPCRVPCSSGPTTADACDHACPRARPVFHRKHRYCTDPQAGQPLASAERIALTVHTRYHRRPASSRNEWIFCVLEIDIDK